ncbi:MAG: hypothetical protein ABIH76_00845 [Candidatus Bathyarchaeota archaeon]
MKRSRKKFLGIDLGASSGRVFYGLLKPDKLKLELDAIHHFPNNKIQVFNSLYWDIPGIFQETIKGIKLFVKKHGPQLLQSILQHPA